jgi:hypothetical protein
MVSISSRCAIRQLLRPLYAIRGCVFVTVEAILTGALTARVMPGIERCARFILDLTALGPDIRGFCWAPLLLPFLLPFLTHIIQNPQLSYTVVVSTPTSITEISYNALRYTKVFRGINFAPRHRCWRTAVAPMVQPISLIIGRKSGNFMVSPGSSKPKAQNFIRAWIQKFSFTGLVLYSRRDSWALNLSKHHQTFSTGKSYALKCSWRRCTIKMARKTSTRQET